MKVQNAAERKDIKAEVESRIMREVELFTTPPSKAWLALRRKALAAEIRRFRKGNLNNLFGKVLDEAERKMNERMETADEYFSQKA